MDRAAIVASRGLAESQQATIRQRIIRSGNLRAEVDDLDEALDRVTQMVAGVGGLIAGSELREGEEGSRSATLTLRIPEDDFQSVVDRFSDVGRILSVSVVATDISREYFDLETRLSVKESTASRLEALLSRTGDLEDLLAVERELSRVTEELESLKGQIRYYDQQVALSDLRVTLLEPGAALASGPFRPVVRAFRSSLEVLGTSLGAIVYLVVFLLPWVAIAIVGWPFVRRRWPRDKGEEAEA